MEDGRIKDSQLAATSSSHGVLTEARHARLRSNGGYGAWCPDQTSYENDTGPFYNQYIQAKLDRIIRIKGITTQGRATEGKEKVEQFWINYSPDWSYPASWKWVYDEMSGHIKVSLLRKKLLCLVFGILSNMNEWVERGAVRKGFKATIILHFSWSGKLFFLQGKFKEIFLNQIS